MKRKQVFCSVMLVALLAATALVRFYPAPFFAIRAKEAGFTADAAAQYASGQTLRVRQKMDPQTPAEYAKIVPGCYKPDSIVASAEG